MREKTRRILICAICACVGFLSQSGSACAEQQASQTETEQLRKTVEEQNRTISELMRRIEALESKQEAQGELIYQEKEEVQAEKKEAKPSWIDRITVGGDFRYRNDWQDKEGTHVRERNRIRARLNVMAKIAEDLDVGMQLSTAETVFLDNKQVVQEGNPLSNNQTLGDGFSFKNIWLTQAYFDWHPAYLLEGFDLIGGKMFRPFYTPGGSELLWDDDLSPEGAVVKYKKPFDSLEMFANAYGFWAVERSASSDTGLFGGQAGLKYKFKLLGDDAYALGGVGDFDYTQVKGQKTFFFSSSGSPLGFGNTLTSNKTYAEGFNELEPFAEFGFKAWSIPVALYGDFVNNTQANANNNAWLLGFYVGTLAQPGSWQFKYCYRRIEKDSLLGAFTDDDFAGGGTDVEGSMVYFGYQLSRYVTLAARGFLGDTIGIASGEKGIDYKRVFLDVIISF